MENSAGVARGHAESVWKIQQCLEAAGIEFIAEDEKGFGVRLRSPQKS